MSGGRMNWRTLKQNLVRRKLLDRFFLDPFATSIRLSKQHIDRSIAYEPLLLETNLQQLAGHLDRALAYRKEISELEMLAVKAASEYDLFKKQSPLNLELELIRLRKPGKLLFADAHDRAAEAFGNEVGLNAGMREISVGSSAELRNDASENDRESAILRAVEANATNYQDAYWQRHTEPGNAHNFAERAKWVGLLYGQDWLVGLAKAEAVASGFQAIYGSPAPELPDTAAADALYRLSVWTREMVEQVQSLAADEFEVDLVLPLVQPRAVGGASLVSKTSFEDAIVRTSGGTKPFKLSFDLPRSVFDMGTAVRLRRVGLAYGMKPFILESGIDRNNTIQSALRYRAKIWTPVQGGSKTTKAGRRRPPVQLGDVSIYGSAPAYSDGNECLNVDPAGTWDIEIAPVPVTKRNTNDDYIGNVPPGTDQAWLDLKLFLRLRCRG